MEGMATGALDGESKVGRGRKRRPRSGCPAGL